MTQAVMNLASQAVNFACGDRLNSLTSIVKDGFTWTAGKVSESTAEKTENVFNTYPRISNVVVLASTLYAGTKLLKAVWATETVQEAKDYCKTTRLANGIRKVTNYVTSFFAKADPAKFTTKGEALNHAFTYSREGNLVVKDNLSKSDAEKLLHNPNISLSEAQSKALAAHLSTSEAK